MKAFRNRIDVFGSTLEQVAKEWAPEEKVAEADQNDLSLLHNDSEYERRA